MSGFHALLCGASLALGRGEGTIPPTRVLVVYGSHTGTAEEVATFVGKGLREAGAQVDVVSADTAPSPEGYGAVVLGSGIRAGQLVSSLMGWVSRHQAVLQNRPVACFLVCMTLREDTPAHRAEVRAYLEPLRKRIPLVDEGLFAGRMDYQRLGFGARFLVKRIIKTPEGDFRDWKAIGTWTQTLAARLGVGVPP